MKVIQKTRRLLLTNAVVAVVVGVFAMHYLAPSQLAKADPINSTDFVMTIDTRKGVGNTFTIPTFGGGYNYNVSCGNGVTLTGQTGSAVCSYAAAGEYQIRISGAFPRIFFNFTGDKLKVISIDQWGTNEWLNMEHAFDGAENLDVKATDKPRMGKVVSLAYMFRDAKNLKGVGADWQWDTANVQSLNSTFSGARQFNQDISNWNTAKVTDMDNTFTNAYEFNQPIQKWDVSKVTTMVAVLAYAKKFNQPIGEWNTARLADALLALAGAEKFDQSLAHWDVRQLTNADGLLNGIKISTLNYDATLMAWQGQAVNNNVKLGGGNSKFCLADTQRSNLVNAKAWTITDGGKDCTAYAVTAVDYAGAANIDENSAAGTVLGRLTSTDAVGSPQGDFTYTLGCAGAQNNLVTIDGNMIKLARSPDYEQNTTLAICVRSTNKAGQTFDKHLTITVNNLLTLSYNANGADAGTVPASTGETLRSGATVAVAANTGNLAKVGHTFTGWNTEANGTGTPYAAGANIQLTGDVTLYAQWRDSQPPVTPAAAPDMTAPSDTGDSNSDNITNKTKPAFTLMCTEAGSTLTLYVDGVANGTVNCTGPGPVNVAPTTPLSEGNHAITFTETDAAGNASQGSPALTVTIDTTAPAAPAVTVDSVTADNTINAAEAAAPQIIRGLATGTRPGDKVRVTVNGTTYETTVDGTGAFAVTVPGAELVSDPDHTIDVTVIASDVAGNTTSTSMTKTYNVDADVVAPPAKATLKSSSDSGASDSDNITNNTTPTVILQCISATDKLHLIVDGVEVQTINCTAVGPVEVTLPNALNDGNHTVVYRRETPAGNISAPSTPLTLTIDTIAPTGTLGTQQATTASPALSGTVTDSAAKVTVTINGVDYPATVAGGTWTLPANVIAALGNGVYSVKLTFTDIAGNTSTVMESLTITLPVQPTPQPSNPSPALGQKQKKSGASLADTGDNGYLLIGISSLAVAAGLIGIYRLRRL